MAINLNKAYQWAIDTCERPDVGYKQAYRNQQTVNGITYYDCSSFIFYALKEAGFDVTGEAYTRAVGEPYTNNAITTSTERTWLTELGWTEVPINGEWKPCDVLWRQGHTEMVYSGGTGSGVTMGAHGENRIALPNQVSINTSTSYASSWSKLYRYGDGGALAGVSIYVASAIIGNWVQESTINAGLWEGRRVGTWTELGHGYGIGQWTNTGGNTHGRLYQLHEWLVSNGYEIDDAEAQIDYLIEEGTWYSVQEASSFATLDDFLASDSTDLTLLTHAFNIGWEGIHDSSWDTRVTYANEMLAYIMEHKDDSSITTWNKGNRYLSNAEMKNNAVLAYRYLAGLSPTPPVPPTPPTPPSPYAGKKGMPVWMMCKWY